MKLRILLTILLVPLTVWLFTHDFRSPAKTAPTPYVVIPADILKAAGYCMAVAGIVESTTLSTFVNPFPAIQNEECK